MNKKILASFAKSCNNDQAAFGAEIKSPSSSGQDAALSRLKHGFDSRWGHQTLQQVRGIRASGLLLFRGTPHGVAQRYAVLRRCKTRPLTPPAMKPYFSVIRWLSNYLITEKYMDTQERRRYGRRGIQGAR